ncbi:MAG: hypothetical protein ABEL97_09350 [Salinibacter sp.]
MTADSIINIGLVLILIITLGGLVFYLHRLRNDFYEACRETDNLKLYADCPMGIPVGSVRSTLALLIVLFAVGYVGVKGVGGVPQFLTAVVSTVLGFYFGSRSSRDSQRNLTSVMETMSAASASGRRSGAASSGGSGSPSASTTSSSASTSSPASTSPASSTDARPAPARKEEAQTLLARLQEGLSIAEVARSVLPKSLRRRFASLTQELQDGIGTVQSLLDANSVEDALRKGKKLLDRFRKNNPVRTVTERALGAFSNVLGAAVEPLPLIGSIVNVATTVKKQVYDRWKRRILHLTFEPADLPVERIDANTGFTLLSSTPIMKDAFREELEANDRPFLEDTAETLLSTEEMESLWSSYSDRFDSRQQFEKGVAALHRAAADLQLREELDDSLFADTGGYETTVAAIDTLHTDEAARGDLDAIVTMVDALRNAEGISASTLRQLFDTVRADLRPNGASS